jgi:hypothetical protein
MTQTQTIQCSSCEGYKRVAIITRGSLLMEEFGLIKRPCSVTYAKARTLLMEYEGKGMLTHLIRDLVRNLDTTPCPDCNATGIAYTLTFGEPGTSFEETA